MAFGYPVFLELEGRLAVVVGSDAVRANRPEALLDAGARVLILAEGPEDRLQELAGRGASIERRGYLPGDLAGAFICVAAVDDPAVAGSIAAEARARGVLVNVMDDIPNCDFAAPALVRRGDLQIAIGTGGRSPALARRLREDLSRQYGPEWTEAVRIIGDVRADTFPALPDFADRARRWSRALDLDELLTLVREGRSAEAAGRLTARLLSDPPTELGREPAADATAREAPDQGVRV
jgi:precorrin-2 dehydrogenase/sirohydrochlorin ferrochelatase